MPKLIPVTPQNHAHKRWKHPTSYESAAQNALLPIVYSELSRAVMEMPIVFTKTKQEELGTDKIYIFS